ncbi:peptidylprolyl isomerase [Candidatus Woesearchaeota archaeon]|nr:peptidylprolyl isomerase [Candidatus Woesearchaeota archaeon]
MNIKKGDFVELEYTGKVTEDNFVFDTTNEEVAKEKGIHNPEAEYGPTVVCIGQRHLLKGLDEFLVGKELGKEYTVKLPPELAFGKKNAQFLKLIPLTAFKKAKMMPEVGMQVEIDGQMGIVKTVSGGRVVVDFNHPLASKEIEYQIKPVKQITDDAEKVKWVIILTIHIKKNKVHVSLTDGKATIKTIKLPEVFQKELTKKIKELVPTVKEVVYEENKQEEKPKQALNTSGQ